MCSALWVLEPRGGCKTRVTDAARCPCCMARDRTAGVTQQRPLDNITIDSDMIVRQKAQQRGGGYEQSRRL
jgi:hypothetical protein